jgi:hypothetical protein
LWRRFPGCSSGAKAHIPNMANTDDVDKPGGWLVEVFTPPSVRRTFRAHILDQQAAVEAVRLKYSVASGETVTPLRQLNVHALQPLNQGEIDQQT